jgi:hypothetical protein
MSLNDNFDWEYYTTKYNDISHLNKEKALIHWNKFGKNEGRDCCLLTFDWKFYISYYKDLNKISNRREALKHWFKFGQYENRIICNHENILCLDDNNLNEYNDIKTQFRSLCNKNIKYIKNIKVPQLFLNLDYETVFIEFREFPHIEFTIRNTICKIGNKFSHTVVCGNLNYNFVKKICDSISSNIKIIKLNYNNVSVDEYSKLLTSIDFWNNFTGNKILIYQDDSCIFKSNIFDFVKWDYIGAPWSNNVNNAPIPVGNGGLSLRTKQCMIDVINKIKLEDTTFNQWTINYVNKMNLKVFPEDVYFTLNMQKYNIGKVADIESAKLFSSESIYNPNSFGGHQYWLDLSKWTEPININIIKKFKKYDYINLILEHRGGWKLILEKLNDNLFFSNDSNILFLDIIEIVFLWNKNKEYICNEQWIGFIHCTQNTPNHLNNLNINNLFNNVNFIKSLNNCKYIISLSKYVADFLEKKFRSLKLNIKVFVIMHPVDAENIIMFDIDNFNNNKSKSLLFIGQQLRKITSFYELNAPGYNKIWLTGTNNNKKSMQYLNNEIKYFNLNKDTLNMDKVTLMYTNTFKEYDELLSNNIVFIDLFDASANNTLLECIIRNTPIIINKVGGVVEYLGENYPLYFNNLNEVNKLIYNKKLILEAYEYLKNMNKECFKMEYFLKEIFTIVYNN